MNLQLIESLVQVILALPEEEQAVLSQKLAEGRTVTTRATPFDPEEMAEQIFQPLIAAGRIIPPAHCSDIPPLLETDLKVMVRSIQVSGSPLSETVIEDRGEW